MADPIPTEDRCPSVFDRWRCGLPQGHGGLHAWTDARGRTTWNDTAQGRRLPDL
ncbi:MULTISPECIES: hypothetical protein [unclassified Curtobacterium]|uniref:hypothetical protein n=1 Tax=unclassified Curtobacterium TaxID=257496 RepID=UPI0015E8E407|nr:MULTISPECIES: hypothetical protein [unclassified Curtobacterium]WIB15802.1 hypothetical protein DEJ34_01345 [Curtobacterium sp. MCPF17_050]WIB36261.1 hypothetical protein DEJ15_03485 [Curtobacterium sp. MCJR17_043]